MRKPNGEPIFIVGTQRSGTTLLRLLLNAHSQIAIPEEATFLMPLLRKKNLSKSFSKKQLKSFVQYLSVNSHFKRWNYDNRDCFEKISTSKDIGLRDLISLIFDSYCHYENKQIWGDKTPSFFRKIDILLSLYPAARVIHIIRDGRDVFDSWRKLDSSKSNAAVIAAEWTYKISRIEKAKRLAPSTHWLTLRYEDLIDNPVQTLRAVCGFLQVNYENEMLNFYRTSDRHIGRHHSTLIFKPLDSSNKDKWKRNLNPSEMKTFSLLSRRCLRAYGYEVTDEKAKLKDFIITLRDLIFGVPLRIFQVLAANRALGRSLRTGAPADIAVGSMPQSSKDQNDSSCAKKL